LKPKKRKNRDRGTKSLKTGKVDLHGLGKRLTAIKHQGENKNPTGVGGKKKL